MDQIEELDLVTLVINTTKNVFDTMLSMELEQPDSVSELPPDGNRIVGSVSFAGKVVGSINIHASYEFAHIITAAMLGMDLDEIEGDEAVEDVVGEITNMIGGDLKSRFCDIGLDCHLSLPSITTGTDFKTESRGWKRHDKIFFCSQEHIAFVELFVKPGK